jgi:hypothetical protein
MKEARQSVSAMMVSASQFPSCEGEVKKRTI